MKRISSNMKSILKKTIYGCLALGCVLTMAACSNTAGGGSGGGGDAGMATYTAADLPTANRAMLKLDKFQNTSEHGYENYTWDLSGDKTLRLLSQKEIKDMLDATNPDTRWPKDNFYAARPKITAPYGSGKLTKEALQAGLDRINVIRRLMGVHPVELDANYTRASQIGTLLQALTKNSGHNISTKPAGMEDSVFKEGNAVLKVGNTANNNLPVSADEWLDDRGQPGNPMHRVWMTSPKAAKFGMGYVERDATIKGAEAPLQTGYSFLRACNQGANMKELYNNDWDFVAWPAPGYCPIGLWPETHVADNSEKTIYTSPWSIQFPGMGDCTITLTKEGASQKEWKVAYVTDTQASGSMSALKVYSVEGSISATANNGPGATGVTVISFYPTDEGHSYNHGDIYTVKVDTLSQDYTYTVEFFDPAQVQ